MYSPGVCLRSLLSLCVGIFVCSVAVLVLLQIPLGKRKDTSLESQAGRHFLICVCDKDRTDKSWHDCREAFQKPAVDNVARQPEGKTK